MKRIGVLTALSTAVVFWAACGQQQQQTQTPVIDTNAGTTALSGDVDYWAKDNFDLERVGPILERSESPEQFERYLNEPGGINNLDLNGDGYVDYISVREFDDRDPYERGLSLYSQFGPDMIQEIASLILYRDEPRYPGARVLLRGDDSIYGDNAYYETNWLDRTLQIAGFLFSDRSDYYRSPYYYDNYPDWYDAYEVVDTPVYRTRIVERYPEPVFVYTASPAIIEKIKIKSPNNGLHLGQIKARLVKPTKEQAEYFKNNPRGPKTAKADKVDKIDQGKRPDDVPRSDDKPKGVGKPETDKGPPTKPAKAEDPRGKPAKPDNPGKGGDPGKGQGKGKKP